MQNIEFANKTACETALAEIAEGIKGTGNQLGGTLSCLSKDGSSN